MLRTTPIVLATLLLLVGLHASPCSTAGASSNVDDASLSARVSRGTTVQPESIPTWYAIMHIEDSYSYGTILCGAFRIDDAHALTAAHCLEARNVDGSPDLTEDVMLFFGNERTPVFATRAIAHPQYSGHPFYERDIALITFAPTGAASATEKIALARDGRVWEEVIRTGLPLQSLGLGVDATGAAASALRSVQLPAVPEWECVGTDDDQWPPEYVHGDLCAGHTTRSGTHGGAVPRRVQGRQRLAALRVGREAQHPGARCRGDRVERRSAVRPWTETGVVHGRRG